MFHSMYDTHSCTHSTCSHNSQCRYIPDVERALVVVRDIEGNDGNGERSGMDSTTSTGDVDSIRVEEALLAVEVSMC